MSRLGHNFLAAGELPIPEDVRPGPGWTEQMLEMAEHIGAYATLLLVDRFSGMRIYIPADWTRGKVYEGKGSIRDVVGDRAAAKLSEVYRREYLELPVARYAVDRAKRGPIIAAVRSGEMTVSAAARKLGTRRPYVSYLANQTDEGGEAAAIEHRAALRSAGQMDLFPDGEDD